MQSLPGRSAASERSPDHRGLAVERTDSGPTFCSSNGTSTASRGSDYNARLSSLTADPRKLCAGFLNGAFLRIRIMSRDSSLTLHDVRSRKLSVVCEACGRRERFVVAKLVDEHGDEKLIDLLLELADCPKTQATSLHDRCKAVYEGLAIYEKLMTSWRPGWPTPSMGCRNAIPPHRGHRD